MDTYDLIVIGGGPGGYVAAIRAASLGMKTALIEKDTLGGCCLNVGCIPTKAILHVAELFEAGKTLKKFTDGIDIPEVDYTKVKAYKDKSVLRLTKGIEFLMKHHGIDVINGTAAFSGNNQITVSGNEPVTAAYKKAIIATGGEPIVPPVFKDCGVDIMISTEALDLDALPESIAIVGGGYIGCEFASAFAAFGVKVTVIEMMDRLVPALDEDIAKELSRAFKKQKIKVLTGAQVIGVAPEGQQAVLSIKDGDAVTVDKVLLAIGRKPYSDGLGLESVGITAERGTIPIDEYCRTSNPDIYAIGDVTGKILLAHVASAQAKIAAANAAGKESIIEYNVVPAALFTDPEVGTVGLTLEQAIEAGHTADSISFPFKGIGRAVASDAVNGFAKLVFAKDTGEILGAHICGKNASDLIAVCAVCMKLEGTLEYLADTIFTHPTFAESIMEAAEGGLGLGIHSA